MTAYDSLNADLVASTSVQINVLRNLNSPIFDQSSYSASVYDFVSVGSSVIDIGASDADTTVSICNLIIISR